MHRGAMYFAIARYEQTIFVFAISSSEMVNSLTKRAFTSVHISGQKMGTFIKSDRAVQYV